VKISRWPEPNARIECFGVLRAPRSRPLEGEAPTRVRRVDAPDMIPSWSSPPHGPPLLGRVSVASKYPGVQAPMQPSDFPAPFGRGSGSPCQRPTSMQELVLRPSRACPCGRAARRRRITGSPQDRIPSRRGEDLRGYWAVLFVRAVVEHPPDTTPPLAPTPLRGDSRRDRRRLQEQRNPRHPE